MCSCLRGFACFLVVVDCSLVVVGRWLLSVGSRCSLQCFVVCCLLFVAMGCCVISLLLVVVCCVFLSVVARYC